MQIKIELYLIYFASSILHSQQKLALEDTYLQNIPETIEPLNFITTKVKYLLS